MEQENNKIPTNYSEAVKELDELVRKMQDPACDLDKLAAYTVRAKQLITFCRERLTKTDEQLKAILKELDEAPQQ